MLQRFKLLPCLRDGDLELPQTGAIIRHLGRKLNLYGSGLEEQAMIDMLHEGYIDMREKLVETVLFTADKDFVSTTRIQIKSKKVKDGDFWICFRKRKRQNMWKDCRMRSSPSRYVYCIFSQKNNLLLVRIILV